jgi:hypothetical protein
MTELLDTCFPEKSDRKYIVISVEPMQQAPDKGASSTAKTSPIKPAETNYLHMTRRFMKLLPEEESLDRDTTSVSHSTVA